MMTLQRDRLFDSGWLFLRGDTPGAEAPGFEDSGWRALDVPHDWSVEPMPLDFRPPSIFSPLTGVWKHAPGDDPQWADPGFDDSSWAPVNLPAPALDMPGGSYAWFRRRLSIPSDIAREPFLISMGTISDCDEVYLNGSLIGCTGVMPKNQAQNLCIAEPSKLRTYWVKPSMLRPGENVVAVCVYRNGASGGICEKDLCQEFEVVGPFSSLSPGATASGYTVGGIAWYRKHFRTGCGDAGKHVEILFDGVYMNSDVWLNGQHVGFHAYGYTSFYYDLTPYLNPPGDGNVLAVRVDTDGVTSRWYSGSGIYRHVWLSVTNPLHVRRWGVHVTTPVATADKGCVDVRVEVCGEVTAERVRIRLVDAGGTGVASETVVIRDGAATARFTVKDPNLWSIESPCLYEAEVSIVNPEGAVELDRVIQPFGIRSISFSVENGFELNGKTVKMIGGCIHHDNGLLGAVALDRAEFRKLELMKQNGYNALRCSHNTMGQELLDACDRMGILVMDETSDQWYAHKTPQDYGGETFEKYFAEDIELMLRRNRNHPSIVIWSVGNEIGRREGHEPRLVSMLERLIHEVGRWDVTRPVTAGNAGSAQCVNFMRRLDLKGYNYREAMMDEQHGQHPDWVMVCTESQPEDALKTWNFVQSRPWVVGAFVWTALDYLGESWCGWTGMDGEEPGWPSFAAPCGAIDLCGFPKGLQYYRNVMTGLSELEILVREPLPPGRAYKSVGWSWPPEYPNWTWPGMEHRDLAVRVVSRCPEVRLRLNGRVVGSGVTATDKIDVVFEIPYEAGELCAEGWRDGKLVASNVLRSASEAAALRLTPDRMEISTSRSDLAFVTVEVVDASGAVVCVPEARLRYRVTGEGVLEASGNGNHKDMHGFRNPEGSTWRGRALAILRPTGRQGVMTLTVEADGLAPASLCVPCVETAG